MTKAGAAADDLVMVYSLREVLGNLYQIRCINGASFRHHNSTQSCLHRELTLTQIRFDRFEFGVVARLGLANGSEYLSSRYLQTHRLLLG